MIHVGISQRTDGLKYEGEWLDNKRCGFGMTTYRDGTVEEGRYKDNVLIAVCSRKTRSIFTLRSAKLRDRVDNAVAAAQRAAQIAQQKADTAQTR